MPCDNCGATFAIAYDRDDFPDVWCPEVRHCEHPGCGTSDCGDGQPRACDLCDFDFCPQHLHKTADVEVCGTCKEGL